MQRVSGWLLYSSNPEEEQRGDKERARHVDVRPLVYIGIRDNHRAAAGAREVEGDYANCGRAGIPTRSRQREKEKYCGGEREREREREML